ncbi:hypothetical protein D918_00856 [Trichuris suis]|nr:hypothetical protein D918_00856 [Trichuris suis]
MRFLESCKTSSLEAMARCSSKGHMNTMVLPSGAKDQKLLLNEMPEGAGQLYAANNREPSIKAWNKAIFMLSRESVD